MSMFTVKRLYRVDPMTRDLCGARARIGLIDSELEAHFVKELQGKVGSPEYDGNYTFSADVPPGQLIIDHEDGAVVEITRLN